MELHCVWLCCVWASTLHDLQQDPADDCPRQRLGLCGQEDLLHADDLHLHLDDCVLHNDPHPVGEQAQPIRVAVQVLADDAGQLEGVAHAAVHQLHLRAPPDAGCLYRLL